MSNGYFISAWVLRSAFASKSKGRIFSMQQMPAGEFLDTSLHRLEATIALGETYDSNVAGSGARFVSSTQGLIPEYALPYSVPMGRWAHVGMVVTSDCQVRIYVDGEQYGLGAAVACSTPLPFGATDSTNYVIFIGESFAGHLNDMAVFSDDLSNSAIREMLYYTLKPGGSAYNPNLKHAWTFDNLETPPVTTFAADHGGMAAVVRGDVAQGAIRLYQRWHECPGGASSFPCGIGPDGKSGGSCVPAAATASYGLQSGSRYECSCNSGKQKRNRIIGCS